ncbi:MAG: lactate utilization protein [Parcubacteria group bacterium]|nr:lactate utilization protein [Parcubacteria group bacterium]
MDHKTIASSETIEKTVVALTKRNFDPIVVASEAEALTKIQELIPDGVSVMNGASETLQQIGYIDLLKSSKHPWRNLHEAILAEKDMTKQGQLRREAVLSDFYLGSVHALTEEGELIISSNTGSQLPHLAFTSPNLVLVVGANKIVPGLAEGFQRIHEYVIPLEDARMKTVYGVGTAHNKTLILRGENPIMGRKVYVIIVNKSLGF